MIKRRYSLIFFLSCLLFFPSFSLFAQVGSVSPAEAEDRDFIRNLFQDKIYEFAVEEAQNYLDKYPEGFFRGEVIFIMAQVDVINKRYHQALNKYQQIITDYPNSTYVEDSLYLSGTLMVQLGDQKKGNQNLTRLLKEYPETKFLSDLHHPLGVLAFHERDWEKAEKEFLKARENKNLSETKRLEGDHFLAWSYHFQEKDEEAEAEFKKLLESNLASESKAKISFQLAVQAQQKKDYRTAIHWYEQQMSRWPNPEFQNRSRFWIAESYYQLREDKKETLTEEEMKKTVLFFTENLTLSSPIEPARSRYHRGWFLYVMNQPIKADRDFQWLQENREESARDLDLTHLRASIFEKRKEWSRANQIYLKRLDLPVEEDVDLKKLWIQVLRNDYRQKDCKILLKHWRAVNVKFENSYGDEAYYYAGKCYFVQTKWRQAKLAFSKVHQNSRFGGLIFEDHLTAIRKTNDYMAGVLLLNHGLKIADKKESERLLTLKAQFHMKLEQWPAALKTMLEIRGRFAVKQNDPWFLIHIAEIYDRLTVLAKNKRWLKKNRRAKSSEYYRRKAIETYNSALNKLPKKDQEARLSLLDLLVKRHEKRNEYKQVVALYQKALPLVQKQSLKDQLVMRVARIYLDQLKDRKRAELWFKKLHLKGSQEINAQASMVLVEMQIADKKYKAAAKTLLDLSKKLPSNDWLLPIQFRLAELYQVRERWNSAIFYYEKVSRVKKNNPNQAVAKQRLKEIKEYLKALKANAAAKRQKKK